MKNESLLSRVDEPAGSVAVLPQPTESLTPATVPPADGVTSMFERLARDPNVGVDAMERLIAMQERIMAINRKAEFDAAFSLMQGELPIIDEKGQIVVDGVVRSRFGRHEDIQAAIKPILAKHGFSIRHKDKRLENGKLLIIGVLGHRSGHSEEDEFECPPDTSGKKNDLQALGSSREYGRRYTTISLLNIVTKGVDDDGRKGGGGDVAADPPNGFEAWWDDLVAASDNGIKALDTAFGASRAEFKNYAIKWRKERWMELKKKAQRVAAS